MRIIAEDYKGKWFVLQDEDVDSDFERKEINVEWVLGEGLKEHVKNCLYYGIPAYIGVNQELHKKIDELEKKLTPPSIK